MEALIAFVEKGGDSRTSPVHYRAKTSALMAMGYLINKSGSQKAIAYLKNYIEPSGVGETSMHGRGAFQPVLAERDTQLSTMAILGLALSGHPTAKEVLQSLQRPAVTESTARFQAQVSDVVSEALKTYETRIPRGVGELLSRVAALSRLQKQYAPPRQTGEAIAVRSTKLTIPAINFRAPPGSCMVALPGGESYHAALAVLFIVVNQPIGRTVVADDFFRAVQLGQNCRRELLAKFHAPLIERINIPDDALGKDLVLVERHQASQGTRGDLRHHNAVGRFIPCEELVGDQLLQGRTAQAGVGQFITHLFVDLAFHQCLSLGKEVGEQDGVMMPNGIVGFNRGNEVARNELGALMDKLVEGVLPVGARLTPDDRAGRDVDHFAVTVDVFAVTLHIALLKIRGKTVHVLIIRQNGLRLGAKEIIVPDAHQSQRGRQVLLKGCGPKMLVHLVTTGEQFRKVTKTNRHGDGQANR